MIERQYKLDLSRPHRECDRSGFLFNTEDLVKQMEWVGGKLIWTGMIVGKPYVDEPMIPKMLPRKLNKKANNINSENIPRRDMISN